ncbi:hypothetical protein TIFTF001_033607 [Ficus carica]|uniref:Uncharacterized protein n=1 Tax=Ficus carica TaxID=3494 RepID=A0AA88DYT8_FICCA|nr:hypothetical protein TIFTF001_033607 [Ficus carica]
MKYVVNLATSLNRGLTSWKSDDDPSEGNCTNKLDSNDLPQFLLKKGSEIQFWFGPWNGLRFSGMPNLKPSGIYTYEFVFSKEEVYYSYNQVSSSGRRVKIGFEFQRKSSAYAICGAYGSCNINNFPACRCLEGFLPKLPVDWDSGDWSHGCVRKTPLECKEGEGFQRHSGIKPPDMSLSWYHKTMNLKECEQECLRNCSCMLIWTSEKEEVGAYFGSKSTATFGYTSPEYTINGIFTVKSDVFSFGVLVLEIVSRKKNRGFRHARHKLNLLGHDRPSMPNVVLMLSSEIALSEPKEPCFFTERNLSDSDSSSTKHAKSDIVN